MGPHSGSGKGSGTFSSGAVSTSGLGDLREKVSKGFFVQPANTGTVTWEQLVAMPFPLNEL